MNDWKAQRKERRRAALQFSRLKTPDSDACIGCRASAQKDAMTESLFQDASSKSDYDLLRQYSSDASTYNEKNHMLDGYGGRCARIRVVTSRENEAEHPRYPSWKCKPSYVLPGTMAGHHSRYVNVIAKMGDSFPMGRRALCWMALLLFATKNGTPISLMSFHS